MGPIPRRLLAVAVATGALTAGPVSGASAAVFPFPGFPGGGLAGAAVGGNQIGTAGCVGTNRPSLGGNNASTSNQTCGAVLSFNGPSIGQIASVVGPTIIGSPLTAVVNSAGPVGPFGP